MNDITTLDQKQLAERWHMHPRTLENWRQQGRGPRYFKLHSGPKAPVRYRIEDIMNFEKERNND
jgi:hypothetical protein